MDALAQRTAAQRDHERSKGQAHPKAEALYAIAISGDPKARQTMAELFRQVDAMRAMEQKYDY